MCTSVCIDCFFYVDGYCKAMFTLRFHTTSHARGTLDGTRVQYTVVLVTVDCTRITYMEASLAHPGVSQTWLDGRVPRVDSWKRHARGSQGTPGPASQKARPHFLEEHGAAAERLYCDIPSQRMTHQKRSYQKMPPG